MRAKQKSALSKLMSMNQSQTKYHYSKCLLSFIGITHDSMKVTRSIGPFRVSTEIIFMPLILQREYLILNTP